MRSDNAAITAAYDELEAAQNNVAALSYDGLTHSELVALESRRETMRRREPAVDHRIINRLAAEASPVELGGTSLADVLATRLRISKGEARRRIRHAELFGPRQALTGEPLPPKLPKTADAQERGEIGAEHVRIIERFFHKLPHWVDYETRDAAEADLARITAVLGPVQLRQAADRLAALHAGRPLDVLAGDLPPWARPAGERMHWWRRAIVTADGAVTFYDDDGSAWLAENGL